MPNVLQEKQGYKKTELGWIPKNWNVFQLSTLGNTYSGLSGKTKDDFGYGKPFITYMNIFKNVFIDDIFEYVNINSDENQNKAKYGDIFFTTSSETPDEVGMVSVLLSSFEDLYLNSFCFGFRLHNFETLYPQFAGYFFRGEFFRCILNKLAQGATRYNLSKNSLLKAKIYLPPINEQQKIAEILSTIDEKIENVEKQIEQAERLKKALMQELLTHGIGHTEFKDSELGSIPACWEVINLGKIGNLQGGYAFKANLFNDNANGYQVIRMSNVQPYGLELNKTPVFLSDSLVDEKMHNYILKKGDLLITLTGTVNKTDYGNVALIKNDKKLLLNQRVAKFNHKQNNYFLYFSFNFNTFREQFFNCGKGGTGNQANVGRSDFENIRISLPPVGEQQKIAEFLSSADEKIEILQDKKSEYEKLKKGLMQKLLTGQIRVKVTNEQTRPQLKIISNENTVQPPKFTVKEMTQEVTDYWNTYRKIDMQEVAKRKGILVYEDTIPPKGQCNYNSEKNLWEIAVQDLNDNYTIGHEIAHFIKHPEKVKLGAVARNGKNSLSKKEEFDAESIASEIVMPYEILEEYLQEEGATRNNLLEINFIKQCAKRFSVSPIAMNRRLKSLDYKVPFIK